MSSAFKFGELSVSIFGESHGKAIGVVIDGLPGGIGIDFDAVLDFMARRAPKKDGTSTMRSEKDFPNVVSGMVDGVLTGTPLCAVIQNTDQHSADYKSVSHLARPGHADYTGYVRYNGSNDLRGGGHFSGRITAPLVFAGAIASQILESKGITTGAHILSIMDAGDERFDPVNVNAEQLKQVRSRYLPLINTNVEQQMRDVISSAAAKLDSVGGISNMRRSDFLQASARLCSTASKTGFHKRYSACLLSRALNSAQALMLRICTAVTTMTSSALKMAKSGQGRITTEAF